MPVLRFRIASIIGWQFFGFCVFISYMDENNIIKLNIKKNKEKIEKKENANQSFSFQTNPIIQKMLLSNINNKKGKFSFKDLFR